MNGDISFMTLLNVVLARELAGGTLILPSSVVDLDLLGEFRGGTVFGTDYLTCQSSHHCCVSFAPFSTCSGWGLTADAFTRTSHSHGFIQPHSHQ